MTVLLLMLRLLLLLLVSDTYTPSSDLQLNQTEEVALRWVDICNEALNMVRCRARQNVICEWKAFFPPFFSHRRICAARFQMGHCRAPVKQVVLCARQLPCKRAYFLKYTCGREGFVHYSIDLRSMHCAQRHCSAVNKKN